MRQLTICICALAIVASPMDALAQRALSRLSLVTSVPEDDYGVSLSPDGQWLVFVSERSGDAELYATRLGADIVRAPLLLAPSPATDHSPAWSPDGRWLAWVSTREDAFGDVWVMAFPDGKPVLISRRGSRDSRPRWTATDTGNVLLYDAKSGGAAKVYAARPGDWKPHERPGAADALTDVRLPFKALLVERPVEPGQPWVLVTDDTNGDGVFDTEDQRGAWVHDGTGRSWRQITPPLAGLNSPRVKGDLLVMSLAVRNNLDVAIATTPFPMARYTGATVAATDAKRLWSESPFDPGPPVARLRQAYLLAPATAIGAAAICSAVDILRAAGRPEQALSMLEFAADFAPIPRAWRVDTAYRRIVVELAVRERDLFPADEYDALALKAVTDLGLLIDTVSGDATLLARVLTERAKLLLAQGDTSAALSDARRVERLDGVSPRVAAQAALLRAGLYEQLGSPADTTRVYRSIVKEFGEVSDLAEEAAMRLVAAAAPADLDTERRIQRLGPLRADVLPGVRGAAGLVMGRLRAAAGDVNAATSVWHSVVAQADSQPRLAARAAFEMGSLYAQLGRYTAAITLYEAMAEQLQEQLFGGAPTFYRQARQRRIDESLAKGNYELQVNDSRLALATFTELAEYEPRRVEAWRGVLEAQWRCGLLDEEQVAGYEEQANQAPNDALAQYVYGLALTYRQPIPERAVAQIEKAILLDGAVPYFHQTLGFVHEHFGRVRDSKAHRAAALREYQRAMTLLFAAGNVRPVEHGRLLINSGNAALGIGSHASAADLYERRIRLGVGFDTPANQFLAYRSAGIALFRATRPDEAVTRFRQAEAMLPKVVAQGVIKAEEQTAIADELRDRAALALLSAGRDAEAVAAFAQVAEAAGPRSLDRVRALRSQGFALHRVSRRQSGVERGRTLAAAAHRLSEALAILDGGRLTRRAKDGKAGGGLLKLDVAVPSDPAGGGSQLGFSPAQERGLIIAALSRVLEAQGDAAGAARRLRQQLSGLDADRKLPVAYTATLRQVALDRLAGNLLDAGQADEATDVLVEAVRNARYDVGGVMHVNANGLSLALAGLAELALAGRASRTVSTELVGTWLLEDDRRKDDAMNVPVLECIERALDRALGLRGVATDDYQLPPGAIRARTVLARALVLEQLATGSVDDVPAGVHALERAARRVRAEWLAKSVLSQAAAAREGGAIKRLAVLANALLVRGAVRYGDLASGREALADAHALADHYGYPELKWWLSAQVALVSANPHESAMATLHELEALVPGLWRDSQVPYEIIRYCEAVTIDRRVASDAWDEAWSLTERWRAARMKLVCGTASVPVGRAEAADAEWLDQALSARAAMQRTLERIRAMPASASAAFARDRLARAVTSWRTLLEQGRERSLPAALFLWPQAAQFQDVSILVEETPLSPGGAALVLSTSAGCGAWLRDGFVRLTRPAAWARLAEKAPVWFVMGTRVPRDVQGPASVINMLTFETTLARVERPGITSSADAVSWPAVPGSSAPQVELEEALIGAESLDVTAAIEPGRGEPAGWRVGGTGRLLGSLAARLPALGEVAVSVKPPTGMSMAGQAALEENIVALLALTASASVRVNGARWVGTSASAAAMPDMAEVLMADDAGVVQERMAAGDFRAAVAPLRRILGIRKALGKPTAEIAEAASVLAQVEGRLGRYRAAAGAARQAVDLLEKDGESASLATALSLYASYLVDDRQFEAARAAYMRAAAIYRESGDRRRFAEMLGRSGVAIENGGRYGEALATYERVRRLATELDDLDLELQQLRRRGRIMLQRQNRYVDAEMVFTRAVELAVKADRKDLALLSRLDVARVRERLGLYTDAVAMAKGVAADAEKAGLPKLRADALLVQAFVQWAGADYFNAFRTQRRAQAVAEEIGSADLRIIGHNTAGLIAWALNDVDEAMMQFDAALLLAEQQLFDAEVASTLNNRGLVYRSMGEYDKALTDFGGALAIDQAESNAWGIAYSQRNIGLTHTLRGEPGESVSALEEALRLAEDIGDRANRAKVLVALGDARRELNDAAAARARYREAVAAATEVPLPEVRWRALYGLALLDRAAGDRAGAERGFAAAIEVVERLRASIRIEELQDGFLLDKQSLYDEMVNLLLDAGKSKEAFEFSERSRARNFIDLLGNQKLKLSSATDQRKLDAEAELRAGIEALEKRVAGASPGQAAALGKELAKARSRYTQLMIELRAENPQLSSFVAVPTLKLATLQGLLDAGTRLVIYHVQPHEVVAWVVGPTSFGVVRTPVRRAELAGVLATYRRNLQAFEDVSIEEQMLSNWLVKPVESMLTGTKRVGIIPHRELHLMPFAAARVGEGYLIDHYALFHSPSASVMEYTFARRPTARRDDKVLAIGNPDLGTRGLDLPFAEKEAGRMSWTFPGARVVTGTAATESWVTQNIGEYGIVHIASHGEYDPDSPLLSAVKLSGDGDSDGSLTAAEIFGLSLKSDLVALSACQTGLGRVGSGDDVVGLNRAFVYAGTHEILSSLWRVDDVATAVLIKHFYRNLAGRSRAEALRRAQIEIRGRHGHPAYWSGIFLSGDWQ